jgi:glycopeptide antibiotics resistance protein
VVLKSVGRIPDQGHFTLRLKHYAENARSLLHIALFFVPVFLTACLIGKRPARTLGIVFALSVEAAQFAFGYGFDWVDVFDLACDATGIVLALVVCQRLQRFSPLVCQDASIGQGSPPLEQ